MLRNEFAFYPPFLTHSSVARSFTLSLTATVSPLPSLTSIPKPLRMTHEEDNWRSCLITMIMLLVCNSTASPTFSADDKAALLELKSSITHDPLALTSNWNPKDATPCSWRGVTCHPLTSRVTALNLSSSHAISTCSRASVSMTSNAGNFTSFSLLFPCFNASFSPKLSGQLPPAIGKISELRVLILGFNGFYGVLPLEIGQLRSLEVLDLGFNAFNGPIPVTLPNCTTLRVINLSGNLLNGTIPVSYAPSLQILALSFNLLSGSIPEELGDNCGSLEHLYLDGNSLSGSIPPVLGNCQKLKSLVMSSNLLGEVIPPTLGKLQSLEVLDLSRNFLSGTIPPELGNCKQLKLLVLKNIYGPVWSRNFSSLIVEEEEHGEEEFNYFDGGLPDGITRLANLEVLWAPTLNLEGIFPQSWGPHCNMKMVNLAGNYFTGEIPVSLGNCKSLFFLDISSNNFTGFLPQELIVPCMVLFNVSHNSLLGQIPSFFHDECSVRHANLSTLPNDVLSFYTVFFLSNVAMDLVSLSFDSGGMTVLHDYSNNFFTGPAPPLLIRPQGFSRKPFYGLWLAWNNIEGNISSYSFDMCLAIDGLILDVSNNKIVGELPSAMGSSCKCLRFLSLAGNALTGSIPDTFSSLNSLVNLNLSRNRLQGSIPFYIGQMKNLKYLSLSSNSFTGALPRELGQLSALEALELSSNSLSGGIPHNISKLEHLKVLRFDHNHLIGEIPPAFGRMTSLVLFDVSFNNLSGSVPLNSSSVICEHVQGNPNLQPCSSGPPPSQWEQGNSGTVSQQGANSPSDIAMNNSSSGFSTIEIALITSASIIFCVFLTMVLSFVCMRRILRNSASTQVSGRKEVVTCNDIGIQLTYENVVRATCGFNIQNCIGSGGFGATYKAEIVPGIVVAVKRLSIGRFQGVQQFAAEIRTLGRVQHPNLVKLIGYHLSESEMFLIYNYLPGGNLEKFIQERSQRAVEWCMLHKIALDIARALAYLHDECAPRVLHRDIKPSNILLDTHFNAYLSDFGLARLLGTSETHATTDVAGTFGYVAPEYAMTCRVSDKADVYSYGVVLLELISDKKALDPSFSSFGNGFNIVAWAGMLLRQGRSSEFFTDGLWDSGPHDDLITILHLGVKCTGDSLSSRPSMRQVAQQLKRIQPPTS